MTFPTCTCGHAEEEHYNAMGDLAECLVEGCECIHFEDDGSASQGDE